MKTWKKLALMVAVFLGLYFLPVGWERLSGAIHESLAMTREYAREHVLLCLVPALFIAGGIAAFVSKASVMKYLGAKAHPVLAYGVASVSGSILAVCSCTVLPLFAGISRMGAGIGPATAFLYSGPAINVLAIILTARVLGWQLGLARAIGAVVFAVVIGVCMQLIFRKEERQKAAAQMQLPEEDTDKPLWKQGLFFATMVGILIFANWARSGDPKAVLLCCPGGLSQYEAAVVDQGEQTVTIRDAAGTREVARDLLVEVEAPASDAFWQSVYHAKWLVTAVLVLALGVILARWFSRGEIRDWLEQTWEFAQQILPLLLIGVLLAGLLLGRPGEQGLIPSRFIEMLLGSSPAALLETTGLAGSVWQGPIRAAWPVWTCLFASVAGALMYFATLTEIPILQGLMGAGMAKGPALSLLLAGPALSLPNMLVIRGVLGTRKTLVYVLLVVIMATLSGLLYSMI